MSRNGKPINPLQGRYPRQTSRGVLDVKPLERRPPRPRAVNSADAEDDLWDRLEHHAMLQHKTSLLDANDRSGEADAWSKRQSRPGLGSLILQALVVFVLAGVITYAMDPWFGWPDWLDGPIETVKGWF